MILLQILQENGFKQSDADPCLYMVIKSTGDFVLVPVYIDNALIAEETVSICNTVKNLLHQNFGERGFKDSTVFPRYQDHTRPW